VAVVITKGILVDVGLEIMRTDRMIDARYATLDERPEALDAIRVDFATHIFLGVMLNPQVRISQPSHVVVAGELVCEENRIAVNRSSHEGDKSMPLDIGNHLSHNLAVSFHSADNLCLALCATATLASPNSANIGLVNLYLTYKVLKVLTQKGADLLEHSPGRLVGHASLPLDLLSRDTASSGGHTIDNFKPSLEWRGGLVEYRPSSRVDLMTAVVALIARPSLGFVMLRYLLAYRTGNALWPSVVFNPFQAIIISGKFFVEILCSIFSHLFIPFHHVLYHKYYTVSRDNYLLF
jgi:hypothetical protein